MSHWALWRRRPVVVTTTVCTIATAFLIYVSGGLCSRRDILRSPCFQVNLRDDDRDADRQCQKYLELPLVKPTCGSLQPRRVPRVYHAMSATAMPPATVQANLLRSAGYTLNYHNDTTGHAYIRAKCGDALAAAFRCFVAPAYRADIFRFCAVLSDGGVYIDSDILLLTSIEDVYSPCAHATVGHDYPQGPSVAERASGLQMKVLAGMPGSPLLACMVESIVQNVKRRFVPGAADGLSLTGPRLLAHCYDLCVAAKNCTREGVQPSLHRWQDPKLHQPRPRVDLKQAISTSVAFTYRDTRQAAWPYAGLLGTDAGGRDTLLAYEAPQPIHFGYPSATHYSKLVEKGVIYHDDCMQEMVD
eukprot:m.196160 g.196160  ORF g.196160 m.196160 type:complete len:359 (+) comp25052_c0_seq1:93-1169(+)